VWKVNLSADVTAGGGTSVSAESLYVYDDNSEVRVFAQG